MLFRSHTHTHKNTHTHKHTHTFTHTHTYTHTRSHTRSHTHTRINTHARAHTHMHTHTNTHTHTHTQTHTHTYTHRQACKHAKRLNMHEGKLICSQSTSFYLLANAFTGQSSSLPCQPSRSSILLRLVRLLGWQKRRCSCRRVMLVLTAKPLYKESCNATQV